MSKNLLFIPVCFLVCSVWAQSPTINWVQKNGPLGGQIIDAEVDPASGKIFLLDGDHRPYLSDDGGETWEKISLQNEPSFNDIEITNGTIFLVGGYDLYASTDGGEIFQVRMTNVNPYSDGRRLKRMPVSGNLVVLAGDGSIYTSTNNGQTWTLRSTVNGIDQGYHLAVNAVDQIFVLKSNDLFEVRPFRSNNGGVSFAEYSSGIPVGHHANSLSAENDGANIYCTTNISLFKSADGTSWTDIKGSIADLDISDVYPGNSFIEFSADGLGMFFIDNINHKLYAKTLNESDWVLRSSDFPSATLTTQCASAEDYPGPTSATAYFGTSSGVFKTITGGASVAEKNVGLASVRADQILAQTYYDNLFLKTTTSELLRSQDKGNTWTRISGLSGLIRNFSATQGALFVLDETNVLNRSYNFGSSWHPLTPPSGGFVWASATGTEKVFGLANTGAPMSLYYSSNNGETWTPTPVPVSGMPSSFGIYEETIRFVSQQQMILNLYSWDDGRYVYYRIDFTYDTNDNITSAIANEISTFSIPEDDIYRKAGANGKIYVYQTYGTSADRIAVSDDGGTTWATHAVPPSDDFFLAENGYIFLSDNGNPDKLFISRDDGVTFDETVLPTSVNLYDLRGVALDNSGFAYLAFDGDYVYQSAYTIVPPDPLTGLEEVGHSATAVALRWIDANNYERDILIERSLDGTTFTKIGQQNGWDICYGLTEDKAYFIDPTAEPGVTYYYRVKAKNEAGESAPTSAIMVTTLGDCPQTIPENRSWQGINSGTEGYTLLGAPVNVGIKHVGGGKYTISNLSLGLTGEDEVSSFYVSCGETVLAESNDLTPNGNGTWDSGTETLTLKWRTCDYQDKTETITLTLNATDPAPTKPTGLFAYVISNSSTEVRWSSGFYEASYVLERSQNATSGFVEIATINYPETSFVDNSGLVDGTTYYYRIKSLNGNTTPDSSPYSDAVSVLFTKPNFVVADNAITDYKASASLGSIWADFNNDGLEDYLTMQYDPENDRAEPVIFENLGNGDFQMVTVDFGDVAYFWPSVADYDNDHYPDLLLTGNNARVLDIFKGNGDFTFTKVSSGQLGDLSFMANEVSSSSWADIDNDGLLDLLVINAEDGGFIVYKQNANHSFTEVFAGAPSEDEPLLSIWADYDNDGYQDVLIGNLDGAGGLYKNNGDLTFTLITGNGLDAANYFTAAWGDYNNDGNIDLYCGIASGNALYKNNGDGTFTKDISTSITESSLTISASWGDFNNDGFLDLFTAGFASTQSRLFIRDASNPSTVVFKKIISEKINDLSVSHYSVAGADPDRNGTLDLALSAFIFDESGDALLPTNNNFYQNNNPPGNWSQVKLAPVTGNSESIGARITLTAGGKTQTREVASVSSLLSRNTTVAHFGLGSATTITNIKVRWPNGGEQNYPLPPANTLLIIDEDLAGPAIISKTPAHNTTGVTTSTSITIEHDENSFAVAGKNIYLTKTGDGTPFTYVDVTSGTKTGNQYTFTLPVTLTAETEYNVTIDAGAFRDRYANASAEVTPGEWKFLTSVVPVISSLMPTDGSEGVSATTKLSVTFDKTVTATSGKIVQLFKSTDLGTAVVTMDATEGVIEGTTVTFTFSQKLQRLTTYHVSIEAGAFKDEGSIDFPGLASSAWSFTTDPGPSITVSPVHNAVDVPVDQQLQITFGETVSSTTAKKLKVLDGTTVISEAEVATFGTLADNIYTYPAPTGGWPFNKLLKVTLDEGAFIDAESNDCAAVLLDTWNFTTVDAPDATPPNIAFTALASTLEKGFSPINIEVSVTDDRTVASVTLKHRKISQKDFQSLSLTFNSGTGKWDGQILNSFADDMGFEYFLEASDGTNTGRLPLDNATHFMCSMAFGGSNAPSITLPSGGTKQSWKIISIPHNLPAPQIESIFSQLGTVDKTKWRLIRYTNTPQEAWMEYPGSFTVMERGKGYFINTKNGGTVTLSNASAPANTRDNLFEMSLVPGWNQIGNPYTLTIDWTDVKAYNPDAQIGDLTKFNSGSYTNTDSQLPAMQGAFVEATSAITIQIPFPGQNIPGSGRKGFATLGTDISADEWALALQLRQGDLTNSLASIGMASDANLSFDRYDASTPPRFYDYLEINFPHPEYVTQRFTRDVVPTQPNYTWTFSVDTNLEEMAELSWNNLPLLSSGKDILLLDIGAQKLVNMKESNSYSFSPNEVNGFRIYYGDNLNISPERVELGRAYPNPTNGFTTIAFSLPETGGLNQSVSLEILDALGRPAGILTKGNFNPGYHQTEFDASDLIHGFYTYRLTVKNTKGQTVEVNKLIIK